MASCSSPRCLLLLHLRSPLPSPLPRFFSPFPPSHRRFPPPLAASPFSIPIAPPLLLTTSTSPLAVSSPPARCAPPRRTPLSFLRSSTPQWRPASSPPHAPHACTCRHVCIGAHALVDGRACTAGWPQIAPMRRSPPLFHPRMGLDLYAPDAFCCLLLVDGRACTGGWSDMAPMRPSPPLVHPCNGTGLDWTGLDWTGLLRAGRLRARHQTPAGPRWPQPNYTPLIRPSPSLSALLATPHPLQAFIGLLGTVGPTYTGVIVADVGVALFGLVAIASGYQALGRTYAALLLLMLLLDSLWLTLFAPHIWCPLRPPHLVPSLSSPSLTCMERGVDGAVEAAPAGGGSSAAGAHVPLPHLRAAPPLCPALASASSMHSLHSATPSCLSPLQMLRLGLADGREGTPVPSSEVHAYLPAYDSLGPYRPAGSATPDLSPTAGREQAVSDEFVGSAIFHPSAFATLFQSDQLLNYLSELSGHHYPLPLTTFSPATHSLLLSLSLPSPLPLTPFSSPTHSLLLSHSPFSHTLPPFSRSPLSPTHYPLLSPYSLSHCASGQDGSSSAPNSLDSSYGGHPVVAGAEDTEVHGWEWAGWGDMG
ncbi:unnamed protein product [Closterium sp. Naga37s-1]|nr:unnamed protein product [Closterium sp. Naga37s-1]